MMTITAMSKELVLPAHEKLDDATRVVAIAPEGQDTEAPSTAPIHVMPMPGQNLGPVRLIRELGRGAMGVVFLGHHATLNKCVAVKVLTTSSPELRNLGLARFADEAKAAAAVQDPHLAQIYHADVTGEMPYLVMEYVEGPTLARLVASCGALSPAVTISVMSDVSAAVARLHDHDIIHRDLKLSNVLLDAQGRAVVSDFGLAVSRPPSATAMPSELRLAGTPAYMAPEMFEGRISPRSDIYAMGIMMYHLLVGKVPFEGTLEEIRDQQQHKTLLLDPLRVGGADAALLEIIERATDKQPIFRYQTADELHRAIAALATNAETARAELTALIRDVRQSDHPVRENPSR